MHSIDELRERFLERLKTARFEQEPQNLYEPNNYFLHIGGKRLRPVLLLMAAELFGADAEEAMPAALAIEYFHNFTLIHDDIMDNAPLRRGFKTLHRQYNLSTAILSGDVLLVKAFESLGKTDASCFKKVFDLYTQTAIEVCEGQQYDMDFEQQEEVSEDEYIKMIRLKSAVLLAASMKIGAIIGKATEQDAGLLYTYAENLGIAFQIQDDILDCYGNEALVGKQPGGDIIQNKKTLLLIAALKHNDPKLKEWISEKDFDKAEKVSRVLELFDTYHIKEYALARRDQFVQRAMNSLEQLSLDEENKTLLRGLIDHLVLRSF